MTIELSAGAAALWREYEREVRAVLGALEEAELDEVIRDLEQHLEAELAEVPAPVSDARVEAVLRRLGPATELAAGYGLELPSESDLPQREQILLFGSLVLLVVGLILPTLLVFTTVIGAVLVRIALQNPSVMISPVRWAGYPALFGSYGLLVIAVLLWPFAPALPLAATGGIVPDWLEQSGALLEAGSLQYWSLVFAVCLGLTGLWWLILGRILGGRSLDAVFYPFRPIANKSLVRGLNFTGGLITFGAIVLFAVQI